MAKLKNSIRRSASVLLSALMCTSALSVIAAVPASAVSYSEMSVLDQYAYSGNDLGAVYSKSSTTFKVWAPTASSVQLKRYKTGSDSESGAGVIETKDMTKQSQGIWSVTVSGDIANTYYTYLVTNNGSTKETVDIYAKSTGVNGKRGMVVDLDSTDPVGWDTDTRVSCPNQTDAVIWEAHVRDFSASSDSGMSNKGKYLAFTETGTTVNNDGIHPTGVDYLEDLGVTHVHLLPVYDYGSVDETKLNTDQFNWGYDPMNYNTPEGSYSTDPYHGAVRVKEFKQMVQSLHNKGIGVVMDVVYNHTYAGGSGVNDWFDYTVPGYYYRQNSNGKYSDASGCGNETASDRAMYQKFMIDSLKYWAEEYHLDGFRFDLMGIHDCDTMNKIREELDKISPEILIYGEPWTAAATPCPKATAVQGNMNLVSEEVAAFNDKVRDAIKGSCFNASDPGFIQGASGFETALKGGIQANSTTMAGTGKWSKQPSQTVTYTSAHDNYTLYDKLVKSVKGGSGYGNRYDDLVAMNKLAGGIILTSQGMSFFQAGEEFARSKGGDENSYKSATSVNQLTWNNTITYADIVKYYKGLISIRKAYAPFRDSTNSSNDTIYFSWGDSCPANVVAFTMYNKNYSGKEWNFAAVIHNANASQKTVKLMTYDGVTLPTQWVMVADGTNAGTEALSTISGNTVTVPARSTVVLIDKTSYDKTDLTSKCTVTVNHILTKDNSVYKTQTIKGDEGASYSTSALAELLNNGYVLDRTTGSVSGTFSKTGAVVNYYYNIDSSKYGSVWLKYIDYDTGLKIADDEYITGLIGTSVTIPKKTISGYDYVDMDASADISVFTQTTPLVKLFYAQKASAGNIVHYYNTNGWSSVAMYAYSGSGTSATQLTGAWPGTLMNNDGDGWFSGSFEGSDSALFIANNNGAGAQDPVRSGSSDGYSVSGEVWIKNGKVYPTGIVKVYLMSTDGSSKTLLQILKGMADGVNKYHANPELPDGTQITPPDNTEGLFTQGVTEVIYTSSPLCPSISNTSTISSTKIKAGETITINGSAENGVEPYTYKYEIKAPGSSEYLAANTNSATFSQKLSAAGTYTFRVTVYDADGDEDTKTFNVTVEAVSTNELQNKSTISSTSVAAGDAVKITGNAAGGTAPYKYAFYYMKSTDSDYTLLGKQYGSSTSETFYPAVSGTYKVLVRVKDAKNKVSKTSFTVKAGAFGSTLKNTSAINNETIKLGAAFKLTGSATGGTAPYKYAFYFKRTKNQEWKVLSGTAFGTATSAKLTPQECGYYEFKVLVMDSTGKVATKSFKGTVKENTSTNTLKNTSTISSDIISIGSSVKITGSATGGTAPYTYAFYYKRSENTSWKTIGTEFGTAATATLKPTASDYYDIKVIVKDKNNNQVTKTFSVMAL